MANLNGTWELTGSDHFEEYMKAIGVTDDNRAKALSLMTKTGPGGYVEVFEVTGTTIKRTITIGGQEQSASPAVPFGKEVDGQSLDGRPIKVTLTIDGPNKLIRNEVGPNYKSTITTVADGDKRTTTLESGGVKATRTFKKA
jgi:hypothetical protein